MRRVLFLVKSYSTHNRQNALCVEEVAKCMTANNYCVDYLSYEFSLITNQPHLYPCYIKKKSTGLYYKIYKLFHIPIENNNLVTAYYNSLKRLIKHNTYDVIIAVINPPETAEAVYRIKKEYPHLNFILYEIDPNSNRYKINRSIKEKLWHHFSTKWEKKIYSKADTIIHMKTHKNHYSAEEFQRFRCKSLYLDIPNFIPANLPLMEHSNNGSTKLLYAGAFYPKLREPNYLFNLIDHISRKVTISFDVFTGNRMKNRLQNFANNNKCITIHDEISQQELMYEIAKADILVSIGNKESDFLPSKTIMYMSTGKPIIHLYSDLNDVSLKYYKHYPMVLLIDQRKEADNDLYYKVISFLEHVKDKPLIKFEYMNKFLVENTPEYSAKKIMEKI